MKMQSLNSILIVKVVALISIYIGACKEKSKVSPLEDSAKIDSVIVFKDNVDFSVLTPNGKGTAGKLIHLYSDAVSSNIFNSSPSRFSISYTYDANGRLQGSIVHTTVYTGPQKHDLRIGNYTDNLLTEIYCNTYYGPLLQLDNVKTINSIIKLQYNVKKQLNRVLTYYLSNEKDTYFLASVVILNHLSDNQLKSTITTDVYENENRNKQPTIKQFWDRGNIITSIFYDNEGSLVSTNTYKYDEMPNPLKNDLYPLLNTNNWVEVKKTTSPVTLFYNWEYIYNTEGQITKLSYSQKINGSWYGINTINYNYAK